MILFNFFKNCLKKLMSKFKIQIKNELINKCFFILFNFCHCNNILYFKLWSLLNVYTRTNYFYIFFILKKFEIKISIVIF